MQHTRICAYCGKEFIATNGMQKFCAGPHFRICVVCGQPFEVFNNVLNSKEPKQCCSRKCSAVLRKQTNIEKYGGISPASNADVQAKMRATTLERYGVEHGAQAESVKAKTVATNIQRYGVQFFTQTAECRDALDVLREDPEFKQRIVDATRKTNLERYGVECIFQDKNMYEKGRET